MGDTVTNYDPINLDNDINEVNIVNLFILLSMCGIEFTTINMPK